LISATHPPHLEFLTNPFPLFKGCKNRENEVINPKTKCKTRKISDVGCRILEEGLLKICWRKVSRKGKEKGGARE
jgi:hypothetical protein